MVTCGVLSALPVVVLRARSALLVASGFVVRPPLHSGTLGERRKVTSDHDTSVDCGSVVFTKERLQKFRAQRQILAIPRKGVKRVRIHRTSASENPFGLQDLPSLAWR